jgi:two-component system OmpR family response regulator
MMARQLRLESELEAGHVMSKILIVDDDKETAILLKAYLEKNQYAVEVTNDGEEFLDVFFRSVDELSLVILDVMLPDTNGFALCEIVRRHSIVPVIMLTASSNESDHTMALALGAEGYLSKPYSPRELLVLIKSISQRAGV